MKLPDSVRETTSVQVPRRTTPRYIDSYAPCVTLSDKSTKVSYTDTFGTIQYVHLLGAKVLADDAVGEDYSR